MTQICRVRAASEGWLGGPGLNTFYFRTGENQVPPVINTAQLCVTRVRAALDVWKAQMPLAWRCQVSNIVDVIEDSSGQLVNSFSVDPAAILAGVAPMGWAPTSTMVLLRLNTSTFSDGARLQGRAFLGPVANSLDDNGTVTQSMLDNATATGAALLDAGISDNPDLVVWRRPREARAAYTKGEKVFPAVTQRNGSIAQVTSITVPDKFAVLRSRRD